MQLVIDANEYIFGLGFSKKESPESLLKLVAKTPLRYSVRICRTIVEEVKTNLSVQDFQTFIKLISIVAVIDEDILVPFELGAKYESDGLKPADAFIAAYAEWTGADVLVTENRHFLTRQAGLPFKVLTAKHCLKFLK